LSAGNDPVLLNENALFHRNVAMGQAAGGADRDAMSAANAFLFRLGQRPGKFVRNKIDQKARAFLRANAALSAGFCIYLDDVHVDSPYLCFLPRRRAGAVYKSGDLDITSSIRDGIPGASIQGAHNRGVADRRNLSLQNYQFSLHPQRLMRGAPTCLS
jgi:hypothetical protein